MKFLSTRGGAGVEAHNAILDGIASDGGLYVPSSFPKLTAEDIERLASLDYAARATFVLSQYITDFGKTDVLNYATNAAKRFENDDPAPLVKIDDGVFVLELWHGPTAAFKDVALTTLPYLLTGSKTIEGAEEKILILVATSGDTGKAALEGFRDVEGTEVAVVYPSFGVSDMQKLQMVTAEGRNVHVLGIDGNFDDAQTAVKAFFRDPEAVAELKKLGYRLSSANSINFGRLVPQITYYISAYCDMVGSGEIGIGDLVNFSVPSGNFGNILAGYYAKRMGLPIGRLIIGSNGNNILTDFWETGIYDTKREFLRTFSPSMDILISSNLERLLFEIGGRNPEFVNKLMTDLKETGKYAVNVDDIREKAPEFRAYFTDENETLETINAYFDKYGYLLDPHTAVAMNCYNKYVSETGDELPTVVVSTASPFKFPTAVLEAVTGEVETDAKKATEKLVEETGWEVPEPLTGLDGKPVLHTAAAKREEIKEGLLRFFRRG